MLQSLKELDIVQEDAYPQCKPGAPLSELTAVDGTKLRAAIVYLVMSFKGSGEWLLKDLVLALHCMEKHYPTPKENWPRPGGLCVSLRSNL